jgi:GT2 family glycosyltransferase
MSNVATLTRVIDKCVPRGIGAGMAIRCDVVQQMGGFDEVMGPGARFGTADDIEITLRALAFGWHVFETDHITVVHSGYRTWKEYHQLSRTDWYAIGAAYARALKCGYWGALGLILYDLFVRMAWVPLWAFLRGRRPSGFRRPFHLLRGIIDGLLTPVDRKHILYLK